MKSALVIFPYYGRAGGWIALAGKRFPLDEIYGFSTLWLTGTHFHFIREIPMFARYEVRSQIVGWDHKWVRPSSPSIFSTALSMHLPFRITVLYRPSLRHTSQARPTRVPIQNRGIIVVRVRVFQKWHPSEFCLRRSLSVDPYPLDTTRKLDALPFERKLAGDTLPPRRCHRRHQCFRRCRCLGRRGEGARAGRRDAALRLRERDGVQIWENHGPARACACGRGARCDARTGHQGACACARARPR